MSWQPTCYVCGSTEVIPTPHPHSPTCGRHTGARGHVVSMQTAPGSGDHLAVCPCGWTAQRPRDGMPGYQAIDADVKAHWRQMCGEAA